MSRPTAWIRFRAAISGRFSMNWCATDLTVFVSTAYLDEAERANRVGFMHHGRMIRCDTPAALKQGSG